MMKLLRLAILAFVLFVVISVLALVFLKWWQALIVILAMVGCVIAGVIYVIKNFSKVATKAMLLVFEVKSKVLRNADVEVHSVVPTAAPPPDEHDKRPTEPRNHYRLDLTIKPHASTGPMQHWDLDDLLLVPYDTPKTTLEDCESADGYSLRDEKILQPNGDFEPNTQGKYNGPQRLQALVAVAPTVRELKFQYYAEQFGHIPLPDPLPLPTPDAPPATQLDPGTAVQ
jgi:hypothetical protein